MVFRDLDLEGCVQTQFDCLYCCLVKIFGVLTYLFSSHSLSHLEGFFLFRQGRGSPFVQKRGRMANQIPEDASA